jgi:hypothetical protein
MSIAIGMFLQKAIDASQDGRSPYLGLPRASGHPKTGFAAYPFFERKKTAIMKMAVFRGESWCFIEAP